LSLIRGCLGCGACELSLAIAAVQCALCQSIHEPGGGFNMNYLQAYRR